MFAPQYAFLIGKALLEEMGHGDPCNEIGAKITLISYQKKFWFTFPHFPGGRRLCSPDLSPACSSRDDHKASLQNDV